jgi:hypothetical protein
MHSRTTGWVVLVIVATGIAIVGALSWERYEVLAEIPVHELGKERIVIVRRSALFGGGEQYDVHLANGAVLERVCDGSRVSAEEIRKGAVAAFDGDSLTINIDDKVCISIPGFQPTNREKGSVASERRQGTK